MLFSILIAAYNEAETLATCVQGVLDAPLPEGVEREIVIVNDGSHDGTDKIAEELAQQHPCVRVFHQERNMGKGAAIRRAIVEMHGDIAIFQDADLEYDPRDYSRLLRPILEGRADVVFGSRFAGEERRVLYFWHSLANKFLTLMSNMLNDTNWTDMETCYKVFRAELLKALPLEANRFGIEPEITAKVARNRWRMYEVPISYNGRKYEEGKKITWRDGLAALWFIFKYRFSNNYADYGKVALDALEQAPRFNRWMYDTIKPWLGQRVVELGAGRGNLSQFIRRHGDVLLTEIREEYLTGIRQRWANSSHTRFGALDLTVKEHYEQVREFAPDTVVALNVLEHIEDDRAVLRNLFETVPSGCRLVILVPFNPKLYSRFDKEIGHWRRYDTHELEGKMHEAGFSVEQQLFFNKAGVAAWFVANTLGKQPTITPWQLRVYHHLTPLFKAMDPYLPMAGLSTVVVARKP